MFFLDIVDETMKFIIYVVSGRNCFVVNADSVCCHGIQETIQLGLGKVCHYHKFGVGTISAVRFGICLVTLHTSQITQTLVELAVCHIHGFDSLLLQNLSQAQSQGSIFAQVVEKNPRSRDGLIFTHNGNGSGKIIDLFSLPLGMGKTKLDDQTVARIQGHTCFNRNGQFSSGYITGSGIDLGNSLNFGIILPQFIVFKFLVTVSTGKFIDGYITVEIISQGKILIGIINGHFHALGIALQRGNFKSRIGSSPVGRRLNLHHIGADFLISDGHNQLKLRAGCQFPAAVKTYISSV